MSSYTDNMPDHRRSLAELIDAFPRDKIGPGTARIYLRHLGDIPEDRLAQAVYDLVRSCDRFPTIRQIRAEVAERMLALPTEYEAAEQLTKPKARRHPLVDQTLTLMGGTFALRAADNQMVFRGQFLKL